MLRTEPAMRDPAAQRRCRHAAASDATMTAPRPPTLRQAARLVDPRRAQPLPPAQRHHPVAAAGDLPGAAGRTTRSASPRSASCTSSSRSPPRCCSPRSGSTPTSGRCSASPPPAWARASSASSSSPSPATTGCCSSPPMAIGIGSSIFHPDSSRVARAASGGRYGFAQSLLPGRRQHRHRARAAARRLRRAAVRPAEHRLVLGAGARRRWSLLWNVGTWARAQHRAARRRRPAAPRRRSRRCRGGG